jgi:hypothetical protein
MSVCCQNEKKITKYRRRVEQTRTIYQKIEHYYDNNNSNNDDEDATDINSHTYIEMLIEYECE